MLSPSPSLECRGAEAAGDDGAALSHGPCAARDAGDASRITRALGATFAKARVGPLPGHLATHPAAATRTAAVVMLEAMRAHVCGSRAWERAGDLLGKLVVLPFVGVSLCGAVTLVVGVQWVDMLQQRRPQSVRLWGALLALLLLLVPSPRLPASLATAKPLVAPYDAASATEDEEEDEEDEAKQLEKGYRVLLNGGGKRGGLDSSDADADADDASYACRPYKRQRSGAGANDADSVETSNAEPNDAIGRNNGSLSPLEEAASREETKIKKPKTRATGRRRRVFIWDLDETLVLFASLYTGTFAQTHGKEVAPGVALGEQMMTFLLAMLERHFFFSQLHNADVDHIARVAAITTSASLPSAADADAASGSDRPSLPLEFADQYARIREIYERRGHVDFLHDSDSEWFAIRHALVAAIDSFSTGWLQEARQVLELITSPGPAAAHSETQSHGTEAPAPPSEPRVHMNDAGDASLSAAVSVCDDEVAEAEEAQDGAAEEEEEVENVNVLVTNTQLVPALCKCLIYQLDAFFPIERVYSSAKVHKYRCFETIMAKYEAPGVEFVAIGDGLEEEQVSLALGLEFHKIRSLMDLKRLRYDLQLVRHYSSAASSSPTSSSTPAASTMSVTSPVGQTAAV